MMSNTPLIIIVPDGLGAGKVTPLSAVSCQAPTVRNLLAWPGFV